MSRENVEVVRRDVEAYLEVASPEIALINPASPLEGPLTGREGIRRFFSELRSVWATSRFHVEDLKAVKGRVVASFVLTTRCRMSEAETAMQLVGVYEVEDERSARGRRGRDTPIRAL
jgi:SnoaL-like protein